MELKKILRIVDPAEVRDIPELGVLSTMANPDLEVATTALGAASRLPDDRARLYWDVILAALPPQVRKALEAPMQGYVYQSEFARKYYSQGHEEGREEGREEGLRSAALAALRAKLEVVTSDDEAAVAALHDERVLTELIGALARANGVLEARAALDLARTAG